MVGGVGQAVAVPSSERPSRKRRKGLGSFARPYKPRYTDDELCAMAAAASEREDRLGALYRREGGYSLLDFTKTDEDSGKEVLWDVMSIRSRP